MPKDAVKFAFWKNAKLRIEPLRDYETTPIQKVILRITQLKSKSPAPLNVFKVFARLGNTFPPYLLFMSNILFKGKIHRQDKELIILRVAWKLKCGYEWKHHISLAQTLGITPQVIESLTFDASELWDEKLRTLIESVDYLLNNQTLTDSQFIKLQHFFNQDQIVEFCMLIGHYVMVAMTIKVSGIQIEDF